MKRTVTVVLGVTLLAAVALVFTCGTRGSASGYSVDPGGSWVVAVTETAGLAGFLGHRHSILVTDWSADVEWRPEAPAASRATVTVPTASLRIDTERGTALAGLDDRPSPEDVAEIQDKMLSAENLAAAGHPELRLEVTAVEPRGGGLRASGRLTVRGRTVPVRFPVAVEESGGGAVFSGTFTVKQTDFGIEPESIAGLVKVADPVEVRFRIALRPGG